MRRTKQTAEYNDPTAPWWTEMNTWCEGGAIDVKRIKPFERTTDRRTVQLCSLLERLATNPAKTIQENDSLTRWLLQKRNETLIKQKFRKRQRP